MGTDAWAKVLPGTLIGERYRVERLLGSGGMSSVYLAHHERVGKPVAIKVLHPWFVESSAAVSRLAREARVIARISHDNVVNVTDLGVADAGHYLVLEYIEGRSLEEVLKDGPLSVVRAIHVLAQITGALSAAHTLGIVHRDVKPSNVMLTKRGSDTDFVKILDFGLARPHHEQEQQELPKVTQVGETVGSPHYMAPECWTDRPPDARSDLYALGVTAWELLNNDLPLKGSSILQLMLRHTQDVPPPASMGPARAAVPAELDELIASLLEKAPERRPKSADVVLRTLARLAASTRTAGRSTTYGHLVPRPTPSDTGELPDPTQFQSADPMARIDGPAIAAEIGQLHVARRRRIGEIADTLWGASPSPAIQSVRTEIRTVEDELDAVGREIAVLDAERRDLEGRIRGERAELRGAVFDAGLAYETAHERLPREASDVEETQRLSNVSLLLRQHEDRLVRFESDLVSAERSLDARIGDGLRRMLAGERRLAPLHDDLWREVSRAARPMREMRAAMIAVGRIDGAITAYQGLLEVLARAPQTPPSGASTPP